uniref:CRIB domain-containing protein n=1 Tax=Leptobrachium leishanense TaxID=445787 RepID=A0A8C5WI45_9ANUR
MPILKQASSHTKKRTRIDREMISAPLGDFRHTMHVGRGGDVFGDTSFLSSHGPSSAPPVEIQAPNKNVFLPHAESMLSFHLDLGPSIMDDVLGIMDRDSSSPEWNTPNDLCGFDYKFSPVRVKEDEKRNTCIYNFFFSSHSPPPLYASHVCKNSSIGLHVA